MKNSVVNGLLLFIKGMAMGAADVVPGVSGGTIAFISGIYDELLESLNKLTPAALVTWYRSGFTVFWAQINGNFLVLLFSGVFLSILSLAHVVEYAQQNHPLLVWGFFFGLILAATIYLLKGLPIKRLATWFAFLLGVSFALVVSVIKPVDVPVNTLTIFAAGAIAVCAMILPGVSGSFLLLIMGMYQVVLRFITQLEWLNIVTFLTGCITGLLAFSHVLSWLLRHFRPVTLAVLSGFLAGSLVIVWPWKHVLTAIVDRHGDLKPLVQENILPWHYEALVGEPAKLAAVIIVALMGFLLVLMIDYLATLLAGKQ